MKTIAKCLLLSLFLTACGSAPDKSTVRIGIMAPFSGEAADIGWSIWQGADLALAKIDRDYELVRKQPDSDLVEIDYYLTFGQDFYDQLDESIPRLAIGQVIPENNSIVLDLPEATERRLYSTSVTDPDPRNSSADYLREHYRRNYADQPDIYVAAGFDLTILLDKMIHNAKISDPLTGITALRSYPGALGSLSGNDDNVLIQASTDYYQRDEAGDFTLANL